MLASISVEQLRGAGLLEPLVRLADANGPDGDAQESTRVAVDELDLDELIRLAKDTT